MQIQNDDISLISDCDPLIKVTIVLWFLLFSLLSALLASSTISTCRACQRIRKRENIGRMLIGRRMIEIAFIQLHNNCSPRSSRSLIFVEFVSPAFFTCPKTATLECVMLTSGNDLLFHLSVLTTIVTPLRSVIVAHVAHFARLWGPSLLHMQLNKTSQLPLPSCATKWWTEFMYHRSVYMLRSSLWF